MSTSYKAAFLAEQESLWERSVESLRECYARHPEDTAGLMKNYDAVADFGSVPKNLRDTVGKLAYDWDAYSLTDAMWVVQSFVSHEIHDDGSPCLVWFASEPVETEGMDKLQALRARTRAPWRVVPKGEGSIVALVRDPGDMLPHREWVSSCAEGSPLIDAALAAVALRDEREAKFAALVGREPLVRKPSPAQVFFLDLLREWENPNKEGM